LFIMAETCEKDHGEVGYEPKVSIQLSDISTPTDRFHKAKEVSISGERVGAVAVGNALVTTIPESYTSNELTGSLRCSRNRQLAKMERPTSMR
jgi:hypothetical protein